VWLQQLANTLVPGAFNANRDNFITDGGGSQGISVGIPFFGAEKGLIYWENHGKTHGKI